MRVPGYRSISSLLCPLVSGFVLHRPLSSWLAYDWLICTCVCSWTGYLHYVYPDANNRAAKLFRLLKLLRLVRMKRILDRWEEDLYSLGIVKLVKLVVMILVSAHWLCCGWFFVGCPLPDEEQQGWVVRAYDDFNDAPKSVLYLDSAFWALMAVVMVRDLLDTVHLCRGSTVAQHCPSLSTIGWNGRQVRQQAPNPWL